MLLLINVKPLHLLLNYPSSWNQVFSSHKVYLHLRICCLGPKPNPSGQDHVHHNLWSTMPGVGMVWDWAWTFHHSKHFSRGELQSLQRIHEYWHRKSLVEVPDQDTWVFWRRPAFPMTAYTVLVLNVLRQFHCWWTHWGNQRLKRWML